MGISMPIDATNHGSAVGVELASPIRGDAKCASQLDDAQPVFHFFGMAKRTAADAGVVLRGAKLVKKAIEAGRNEALSEPEPVASVLLKKLVLPNGEPISSGMKELLKVDSLWLGMEFDEDEGDIEATSFDDLVEDHFGAEASHLFAEASELFDGDCIVLGGASDAVRFLYVGEADETGEYPVISVRKEPTPWVGGFVPFDVWVAQELGALEAAKEPGAVPAQYEAAAKALAEANGDGRLGFVPTPGEKDKEEEDDEDDEDDEDEDEDEDKDKNEDKDKDKDKDGSGSAGVDEDDEDDEEDSEDEEESDKE
jgi:hypothetical protein